MDVCVSKYGACATVGRELLHDGRLVCLKVLGKKGGGVTGEDGDEAGKIILGTVGRYVMLQTAEAESRQGEKNGGSLGMA